MSPPSPRLTVRFHRLMWRPVRGFIFLQETIFEAFTPADGSVANRFGGTGSSLTFPPAWFL